MPLRRHQQKDENGSIMGEGGGRFPEGAFAALVQRADEALGNSAATILKPEGLKYAAPEACGARPLYKGEKWRPEGTCLTPDTPDTVTY